MKYTTIMIKMELKRLMEDEIGRLGKKMTYGNLIKYLIEKNRNEYQNEKQNENLEKN